MCYRRGAGVGRKTWEKKPVMIIDSRLGPPEKEKSLYNVRWRLCKVGRWFVRMRPSPTCFSLLSFFFLSPGTSTAS